MSEARRSHYRIYYEAQCSTCGEVVAQSDDSAFVQQFFLPNCCQHCGEYPDANIRIIQRCWVKPKFKISEPRTWFGYWEYDRDGWNN